MTQHRSLCVCVCACLPGSSVCSSPKFWYSNVSSRVSASSHSAGASVRICCLTLFQDRVEEVSSTNQMSVCARLWSSNWQCPFLLISTMIRPNFSANVLDRENVQIPILVLLKPEDIWHFACNMAEAINYSDNRMLSSVSLQGVSVNRVVYVSTLYGILWMHRQRTSTQKKTNYHLECKKDVYGGCLSERSFLTGSVISTDWVPQRDHYDQHERVRASMHACARVGGLWWQRTLCGCDAALFLLSLAVSTFMRLLHTHTHTQSSPE